MAFSDRLSRAEFITGTAALAGSAMFANPLSAFAEDETLHIGVSNTESQAEGFYADELGYFKKAGLSVDILTMKGGSATVAGVVGNALQLGCSNPVSIAQAVQKGVPLVALVGGSIWDSKYPTGYAVVALDSPIKSGKDLENQTVAVSSLGGLNQLVMMSFIDQAGGNVSTVKFVEISAGPAIEALASGKVAAAYVDEPDLSSFASRFRKLGPASDAVAHQFAQTMWFTNRDWLNANKPTARKFISAIVDGGKWAMSNSVPAAAILQKRLGQKQPRATIRYATSTDVALLQVVLDRAAQFKFFPPAKAADFFWDGK